MNIYRYLSKYTMKFKHNDEFIEIARYGWSNESQEAAIEHAKSRCADAKIKILAGEEFTRDGHYYSTRRIYEQPLEWFDDLNVIYTRNNYSATCLNVEDVVILDIDDAGLEAAIPKIMERKVVESSNWLAKLFGGKKVVEEEKLSIETLKFLENKFDHFIQNYPKATFNLYRTYAGYRVIVLHDTMNVDDERLPTYFNEFWVDSLYRKLCYKQRCFRARLTAKPWRMAGMSQGWKEVITLEKYEKEAQNYAACHFIKQIGTAPIHPKVAKVVELHDNLSKAHSHLPLA
ncbi:hypothetical protein B0187_09025 [Haemophilus paracuniculus]|uniref:Uncharacterized protein n=1 Tax=Haemophilus paracuniculus TaxID=734 RepID=A0A1T0AQ69_9PAST|nr:hypothetical protein [Haemophilus paracuniculus]OOR98400.1 hypothetical protein B0187_09025 [Haemophilus paracuniculus]